MARIDKVRDRIGIFLKAVFVICAIFLNQSSSANPSNSSEKIYSLKSGEKNYVLTGERKEIRASGTVGGLTYKGSGTYVLEPAIFTIFKEAAVFANREKFSATLESDQDHSTIRTGFDYLLYYDAEFKFIGEVSQNLHSNERELAFGVYTEYDRASPMPAQVKVNDFGELSSATIYRDKSKKEVLGKVTRTYLVGPDSESSVIIRVSERHFKNDGGFLARVEGRYRIDELGRGMLVSWEVYRRRYSYKFEVVE